MEVQEREGITETLSAQLHNEKSNRPLVSIRHVMSSVSRWSPQLRSGSLSIPHNQGAPAPGPDRDKAAHKYMSLKKYREETGTSCVIAPERKKEKEEEKNGVRVQPQQTEQMLYR